MAVNRMFGRSQRRRLAAAMAADAELPVAPADEPRTTAEPTAGRGDLLPSAQRQLAALVPTRGLSLTGCFVAGALLIGLAVGCDAAWVFANHELLPASDRFTASLQHVRTGLSLQGQGTLAGWLTQVFLLLAAALALVVRSVQRHRRDEFSGRFRAWGWLALIWLVAAAATAMPLGPAVAATLVAVTETPFGPHGLGWWLGCGTAGLLVTVPWAVLRMRERLPTAATLSLGLLAWAAAVGSLWFSAADPRLPLLATATWLLGSGLVLLAMMLAVRSSLREIDGLCPQPRVREPGKRTKKRSVRPAAAPVQPAGGTASASPAEQPDFTPALEPEAGATADSSDEFAADDRDKADEADESEPQRRLSKAERRRLRKLARSGQAA